MFIINIASMSLIGTTWLDVVSGEVLTSKRCMSMSAHSFCWGLLGANSRRRCGRNVQATAVPALIYASLSDSQVARRQKGPSGGLSTFEAYAVSGM
jgi:hypothetical protein